VRAKDGKTMTRNKDLKRIIRTRMQKTGEAYTAARAQLVKVPPARQPLAPAIDRAALAGMSDAKITAKTGRTWQDWERVLDADQAATLPHRDIARLVHGKHGVDDWWAQTVTVGYERIKGLRDRGQRRGGAYEASKSRTFDVPVGTIFEAWTDEPTRRQWLDNDEVTLRSATPQKRLRLQWTDGAIVAVEFTAKSDAKCIVAVTHTKLASKAAVDQAKTYWTGRLEALAAVLAEARRAGKAQPAQALRGG
jgi:hypothetical protein